MRKLTSSKNSISSSMWIIGCLFLIFSLATDLSIASSLPASTTTTTSSTLAISDRKGFASGSSSGIMIPLHRSSRLPTRIRGGAAANNNNNKAASIHSLSGFGPIQTFLQTLRDARKHLAAAAVARSVSIFGMYPVDTIKTRVQLEQANPLRLAGLYAGVGGSLFGQVPYGVLTFGSYEMYKKTLTEKYSNIKPIFIYALSAILGDITGSGWLCPSEVVKQQIQAGMYDNVGSAIQGIWKKKGFFKGFYQGYVGGLARDIPFRVAQLTSYEVTKNLYLRIQNEKKMMTTTTTTSQQQQSIAWKEKRNRKKWSSSTNSGGKSSSSIIIPAKKTELSSIEAAVCGAIAGSFSAAITTPLDRIKTLLMIDSTSAYGGSVVSCAQTIWKQEGPSGFFQGLLPRVGYIAPSVAIFFIAYENVQQRFF
eukprot:CAMPEP_0184871420 /NCGR_PEP_ID=MMETSP0580-20130426/40710_1 /TAXON_ID=1118495 /ORGANISM="Dactyliosolen fragilissimus" /LENGTH=421 /DNA_ID=CAMNT_0027374077 /DNA_START=227 /DNA_END=1492 /DNA_ORIENTATION=-